MCSKNNLVKIKHECKLNMKDKYTYLTLLRRMLYVGNNLVNSKSYRPEALFGSIKNSNYREIDIRYITAKNDINFPPSSIRFWVCKRNVSNVFIDSYSNRSKICSLI